MTDVRHVYMHLRT